MKAEGSERAGLVGALRSLVDRLLAALEDRMELFVVELQEEKYRLIKVLILLVASAFAGMLSVIFLSLTLVYVFWESARMGVLTGLAALYTGATLVILVALRRFIARQPGPFSATRREIAEDRKCIRNEN